MSDPLPRLGRSALAGLAESLSAGRVQSPIGRSALRPHVAEEHLDAVSVALSTMEPEGMEPRHIALALQLLVEERDTAQRLSDRVELVWSRRQE